MKMRLSARVFIDWADMVTLNSIQEIVERILLEHTRIPYAQTDIQTQTVFDRNNNHFLLVTLGWGRHCRVHGTLAHVDVVGDKVWIQTDGTEEGLANQLVKAGIPPQQIVLGYRIPETRKHTGFAVA
jgi:hypothetical protein